METGARDTSYSDRSRIVAYITIAIRLRYDDNTTHSTTTEVIEIKIWLRYNYDPTMTYRAASIRQE